MAPDTTSQAEPERPSRSDRWRQKREEKVKNLRPSEPGVLGQMDRHFVNVAVSVIPNHIALEVPKLRVAGVQPVFGSPGKEFTAGVHYEPPSLSGEGRFLSFEAVGSPSRYYGAEAFFGREYDSHVAFAFARYRHQPNRDFFGIGPASDRADRSTFRLNEGLFGALGGRSIGSNILVGGHLSYQFSRLGEGRGDNPQVAQRFGDKVPEATEGSDHLMIGAFFEYDSRDESSRQSFASRFAPTEHRLRSVSLEASQGFYLSTEVTHNVDTQSDQYGFTRYTLDAREFIPIDEGQFHGFAFRQFASFTQSGDSDVPFYRLQSIGGSRSLRGYETDRFRDRNVILMNAEVRCQIWHHMDMALFTDAGHVFNDAGSLGEGGVRVGYGIGFRVRNGNRTLGRIDLARSDEGWQVTLDVGSLF